MGSDPHAGAAVSTNNASNALCTPYLKIPLILDHISPTPVLDVVDNWPRSTTQHRTEWFRLTRDLIQSVIADMDLDPDSLSQAE